MTKNIGKCLSLELEFDVFADCTPPEKGDPQTMDGPGSPDYPAEIEITSVQFQGVEIIHLLKRKQLAELKNSFISEMDNEDPTLYCDPCNAKNTFQCSCGPRADND